MVVLFDGTVDDGADAGQRRAGLDAGQVRRAGLRARRVDPTVRVLQRWQSGKEQWQNATPSTKDVIDLFFVLYEVSFCLFF